MTKLMLSVATLALLAGPANASEFYKISVTRKGQDLYKIDNQDIYIKTRYCYEYVHYQEAILQIDSPSGYTIGKLIFVNSFGSNNECDVEKVIS